MKPKSKQTQLLTQLDEIRLALLDGKISSLEGLTAQTGELSSQLVNLKTDADFLKELKLAAGRNLPLLSAARRGFSDAMKRRQLLQGHGHELRTYDSAGHVSDNIPVSRLEQKL